MATCASSPVDGTDWTSSRPSLVKWLKKIGVKSAILDGELVANDDRGMASFQRLQNALKADSQVELIYHVFDLPYCNGYDLRAVRLEDRKAVLAGLLTTAPQKTDGHVRYASTSTAKDRTSSRRPAGLASKGLSANTKTRPTSRGGRVRG
jgi:bifunctional non-homologous end joining protein LigD